MKFEDLLSDYNLEATDLSQFLANALLAALLTWLVSEFYKKYGRTVSNRSQFASNFIMLALATMLIIYIVKSSVALSLGLVGALSIVRFRAAIKEPEELTYLFLVIGIGLGMGANQPAITIIATILILALVFLYIKTKKVSAHDLDSQMVLNISTEKISENDINDIIASNFTNADLRRMSMQDDILFMSYLIDAHNFDQLSTVKALLVEKDDDIELSFIENKNMIS